jgi:hypothetical protein
MEWRYTKESLESPFTQMHSQNEFRVIIDDSNIFRPYLQYSMKRNCELMSIHLRSLLCLSSLMEYQDSDNDSVLNDPDRLVHNEEILDFALQFDLPIF